MVPVIVLQNLVADKPGGHPNPEGARRGQNRVRCSTGSVRGRGRHPNAEIARAGGSLDQECVEQLGDGRRRDLELAVSVEQDQMLIGPVSTGIVRSDAARRGCRGASYQPQATPGVVSSPETEEPPQGGTEGASLCPGLDCGCPPRIVPSYQASTVTWQPPGQLFLADTIESLFGPTLPTSIAYYPGFDGTVA